MDTLKAIQVFVTIHQYGSFTKAAEHLNYSRAMVSRYLEHLETTFSTRLFQRNTRKISLTPSGEKALIYCENILQQQSLLYSLSAHEQHQGIIRISCSSFLFQMGVDECIAKFRELFPKVEFDIQLSESTIDLIEDRVDIAFRIAQNIADGLIARPVYPIPSTFCASPQFLEKIETITSPNQLAQHDCIVHYAQLSTWTFINSNQQPQNYPIKSTFKSNDVLALYKMCRQGCGISMLPTYVVQNDLKNGDLKVVLPEYTAPDIMLSLVYTSRHHLPLISQKFIGFIQENLPMLLEKDKYTI
ncbi:LysR family transcriptional regulator [Acinetobacter nectaris]|uniref:LysR family transcriptional regulator n=1 Tax=Acinetobacter nectaris TaxID=1219382 RepID=UPI001F1FA55E|nr:LysR family transcriptional regulator [Acinetobacter nectaris]MCF9034681.1 LysR family transcriptional regulator [Acinetobacter nectaris]